MASKSLEPNVENGEISDEVSEVASEEPEEELDEALALRPIPQMQLPRKLKMIVFDLDYTLWPFWMDTHVQPPFVKIANDKVVDSRNRNIETYLHAHGILEDLNRMGYTLAVASLTSETKGAQQLMEIYGWDKLIQYKQIFPSYTKDIHFQNLRRESGINYNQMLFFDDESDNVVHISKLGVITFLVEMGITKQVVEKGLLKYAHFHP